MPNTSGVWQAENLQVFASWLIGKLKNTYKFSDIWWFVVGGILMQGYCRGFIPLGCRKFTLNSPAQKINMIFKCWNVETKKTKSFQGPKNEYIFLRTRRRFF
jgi:hypothetical protein